MKLFVVGILLVGVALAHPVKEKSDKPENTGRTRRDVGEIGGTVEGFAEPRYEFLPPAGDFLSHQYISVGHEYGAPPVPYIAPAEEYGPPPHEEYGPPPAAPDHYCPEEDIVPPFVPAPPAPMLFPLPEAPFVPEFVPPPVPYVEYGPPAEEYYVPSTEALTTTTEIYYPPPPPPVPIFYAPYPAPIIETTTLAPVVKIFPYPPEVKTGPYPPAVKTGPYPAAVIDTGNGAEAIEIIPAPEISPPVVIEPEVTYTKSTWSHPLKSIVHSKVHRFLRSLLNHRH